MQNILLKAIIQKSVYQIQSIVVIQRILKYKIYNSPLMQINLPLELLQVEQLDYSTLWLSPQKSAQANKYMPPQSLGCNEHVSFQHQYLLKLWKHWLVVNQNTPVDPDEINITNNLLANGVSSHFIISEQSINTLMQSCAYGRLWGAWRSSISVIRETFSNRSWFVFSSEVSVHNSAAENL